MVDTVKSSDTPLTDEQERIAEIEETDEYIARKAAQRTAVDDGDAAHGGGLGSQGSAVDFGRPKNYSDVDEGGL